MQSCPKPAEIYSDGPALHGNLLWGSFQLLAWLFFHPAAWRHHISRLDDRLNPDFALSQLDRVQWRNPRLHRLLLMGYLILPVVISLTLGLIPWWRIIDISGREILLNVLVSLVHGAVIGLIVGLTANVGLGIVYAAMMSVVLSLTNIEPGRLAYGAVISLFLGGSARTMGGIVQGLMFSAVAGLTASVAVGTAARQQSYPLLRQVSGFIAGLLMSGVTLIAARYVVNQAGPIGQSTGSASGLIYGAAGGLVYGLTYVLIVKVRSGKWHRGLAIGLVTGLLGGLTYGVLVGTSPDLGIYGIANGVASALMFGGLFALPFVLAKRMAGTLAGAVAGAFVGGLGWMTLAPWVFPDIPPDTLLPLALLAILLGLIRTWWQPVILYPILTVWNFFLFRLDEWQARRPASFLRFHSVFWDEYQRLPLFDLDYHLVLIAGRRLTEGQAAIDYVSTTHQRWAAQAAQINLEARWLQSCTTVEAIGRACGHLSAGHLAGPASALLRSFNRISQDVLAALRQESSYNQRLALSAVEDRLDSLVRELNRSSEPYAVRFSPIAARWRELVAEHKRALAATVELRQEIDSPYVIGVPLTEQQEIFIGRTDISARIEQLLRDERHLPLLLYGQRRMGKTSLLNNLGRLLPSTLIPLFVDLQGPPSQADGHAGFLYNLARGMVRSAQRQRGLSLPALPRETLATEPFTGFDEWLDQVEQTLGGGTALLALDEFESLEAPIREGRFNEAAVLGMFRHLIQHRPRFKVLLTGSHSVQEFERWASYLINVQMVQISYLSEVEARQLIERPVADFALCYEPAASQQVIDLTRGHPFLVQLLCAEIVALKNEQEPALRRLARLADVEAALPRALDRGSFFFADIQRNQLDEAALELLRFMAAQGAGALVEADTLARQVPAGQEAALSLLSRRELIESSNGGYRVQVELIRRWFARG